MQLLQVAVGGPYPTWLRVVRVQVVKAGAGCTGRRRQRRHKVGCANPDTATYGSGNWPATGASSKAKGLGDRRASGQSWCWVHGAEEAAAAQGWADADTATNGWGRRVANDARSEAKGLGAASVARASALHSAAVRAALVAAVSSSARYSSCVIAGRGRLPVAPGREAEGNAAAAEEEEAARVAAAAAVAALLLVW